MKILNENNNIAGIHSIYNCAKFYHDCDVFTSLGCPKVLTQNCNKKQAKTDEN